MRKTIVIGAVVLVAIIAGAIYFLGGSPDEPAQSGASIKSSAAVNNAGASLATQPDSTEHASAVKRPPDDPRLIALLVSPDNGSIEFIKAQDGKVIAEIDNNPGSLGFKKPMREYTYARDRVIALTSYRYFGDHREVTRTTVSYKPDGSVDQYAVSTDDVYPNKTARK